MTHFIGFRSEAGDEEFFVSVEKIIAVVLVEPGKSRIVVSANEDHGGPVVKGTPRQIMDYIYDAGHDARVTYSKELL